MQMEIHSKKKRSILLTIMATSVLLSTNVCGVEPSSTSQIVSDIGTGATDLGNSIGSGATEIGNTISDGLDASGVTDGLNTISDGLGGVTDTIDEINTGIDDVLDSTGISGALDTWSTISSWWAGIQSLSGLTSINSLVGDFIGSLSGISSSIDNVFSQFNLGGIQSQISGINDLMQCFGTGFDMSGLNLDGICSTLQKGNGLGAFSTCLVSGNGLDLSSLCGGSGSSVNLDTGEVIPAGGDTSGARVVPNNTLKLDATSMSTVATVTYSGINESGAGASKKVKDITYPSGIKGDELFGGASGGAVNKKADEVPAGSEAKARSSQDLATLYLSEVAIAQKGKNMRGSDMRLSANKVNMKQSIFDNAQQIADATQDFDGVMGSIITKAQPKFVAIEADTLTDYEVKEGKSYRETVDADESYKQLTTLNNEITKMKYAPKFQKLISERGYIFDPTEATASKLAPEQQAEFRFRAFMQIAKEMDIANQMAVEMTVNRQLKETMIRRGRYGASIFRSDIALKEIDALLKAVDQTIR